jgi:hypothetical protein
MEHKSATLDLVGIDLKGSFLGHRGTPTVVAGLVVLLLSVVAVAGGLFLFEPGASSGIAAGIEATSARWSALGASYAPDYETIAEVSSARYTALARSFGRSADSARWAALGASYAPDYETIAEVSSARYTALAESYGFSPARSADSARWSALGASYAPDYEAIAAVSSARWAALGEWYTAEVLMEQ